MKRHNKDIVKLVDVANMIMGQSPASSTYNSGGEGLPFFQGKAEFTELHPVVEKWCTSPTKIAQAGDILVSVRAPVGATNIANCECCIGRGLAAIRYPQCSMYLFYYLRLIARKLDEQGTGTTFRAISGEVLRQTPIPLPPLAEQHRIVAKIEELFSRLDKGVEALKTAQAQLKTYRQAVLKWAFEGRLTNEHVPEGELPEGWRYDSIIKYVNKIQIGPFGSQLHREDYIDNGIPLVNPMHIKNGRICPDFSYSIRPDKANTIPNYILRQGDVVLGRRGEMGRCGLVYEHQDGWICGTGSLYIRPDFEKLLPKFLHLQLNCKAVKKYLDENAAGTTMANLNSKIISNLPISVPPISEQSRIVAEIEARFSVCDKLEESITGGLAQAEALRQSILKRAFEGRLLSEQELAACRAEPDWEPAEKLLERIRAERAAAELAKPARAARGARPGATTAAKPAASDKKSVRTKRNAKPGVAKAAKPSASDNKSVRAKRVAKSCVSTAAIPAADENKKTGRAKNTRTSTQPDTASASRPKKGL